jgi:dihydrofolate reductase
VSVTLVVACDLHRVIGVRNALPWHLPGDLQRFRALTTGHAIVMGRRTAESIGRALPGRMNIVVSHDASLALPGRDVVNSLEEAITRGAAFDPEVMVIGGAQLYAAALPHASRVVLTIVHGAFAGDAWLPPLDTNAWCEAARETLPVDDKNAFACTVYDLRRAPADLPRFLWP